MKKYIPFLFLITLFFFKQDLVGVENIAELKIQSLESGAFVQISNYRGKPVLLNFWAPWCIPCLVEFPELDKLYKKYKTKIHFLAVTNEENPELRKKFLAKTNVTFPLYFDPRAKLHEALPVVGMPFTVLLNAKGEIHKTFIGYKRSSGLEEITTEINKLLSE